MALECEVLRYETPEVAVVALSNGVNAESEVRVPATGVITTDSSHRN